jgi:hypothetical protein
MEAKNSTFSSLLVRMSEIKGKMILLTSCLTNYSIQNNTDLHYIYKIKTAGLCQEFSNTAGSTAAENHSKTE